MFVRAKIQLLDSQNDLDLWAVDLIENHSLSQLLEDGWWWCTWPNQNVELFFDISSDVKNAEKYKLEIQNLLDKAKDVVEKNISIKPDAKYTT